MSIGEKINEVLSLYETIALHQLDGVSLMNRMDLKYVFSIDQLPDLLHDLKDVYRVLEIENERGQQYETLYFDTDNMDMYQMHHRGELERHKIRFRKYKSSDTVFLEVKVKDNKGKTEKNRIECQDASMFILNEEEEFLSTHTPFEQEQLKPVLQNTFQRITLVSLEDKERITIDYGLKLRHLENEKTVNLPGIAIAEIKREGVVYSSRMSNEMKRYRIHPMRFSKYCVGIAKMDPSVSTNRFKALLRKIDMINSSYELQI